MLAWKLSPVTKPEGLFAAIEKLKTANITKTLRDTALSYLKHLLGQEAVEAFTNMETGEVDLDALLGALRKFLASEDKLNEAKNGDPNSRETRLAKALSELLNKQALPAPPRLNDVGKNDQTATPQAELPTPAPIDENSKSGTGGHNVGNGDLGIGDNLFNPFASDPNQVLLDQVAQLEEELANMQEELDRARADANRNRERGPGNPRAGSKNSVPLPQPGGGAPPSLTRQKLEVTPATIPDPVAPPTMVMPPVMPETPLGAETVNKLAGGMLPPAPQPSSTFDKLMQETAALRELGLQELQSIYARLNAVVASPQLTSPPASAGGLRTIGDRLREPGRFPNRRPPGAPRPPDRYPSVSGNVLGGPSGLGAPPARQPLRPRPPSLGLGGPSTGTVTAPTRTRAVARGERRTTSR
jgi:hypothetical protein